MKQRFVFCIAAAFVLPALLLTALSCQTNHITHREAWYTGGDGHGERRTVFVRSVTVNRAGGWDSIHSEVSGLVPLLLWKQGLHPVSDYREADYSLDVRLHEREYLSQWRTMRSLALEVRIWGVPRGNSIDADFSYDEQLPLALGRVVTTGNQSFSSSQTIRQLLVPAVQSAASQLTAAQQSAQAKQQKQFARIEPRTLFDPIIRLVKTKQVRDE